MKRYNIFYFIGQALSGLWRNGVMSFASIAVLMSCLVVIGGFSLLVETINLNLEQFGVLKEIVVFCDKDATEDEPSDLPEDIVAIVWGIAEQEFSILRNGAQGLAAFSISDVSWTFDKEPRASWMETLAHYMRW